LLIGKQAVRRVPGRWCGLKPRDEGGGVTWPRQRKVSPRAACSRARWSITSRRKTGGSLERCSSQFSPAGCTKVPPRLLAGGGGPYLNTLVGNAETLPTHAPAHPAPRVRGDAVRLPKPSAIPPYRAASGVHAMPTLAWKYQTTRFFLPTAHQLAGQDRAKTAHAR